MKLLMVSPNLPSPTWGASTRNYHLLKALARQHTVSLLALDNSAEVGQCSDVSLLKDLARTVQLIPCSVFHAKRWQQLLCLARGKSYFLTLHLLPEMQVALDAMLAGDNYDAVLFESSLMAGYRLPARVKIIIDQHNIEHELLKRTYEHENISPRKWYNWQEYRLLKQVEIERCQKADVILVTSERERLMLQGLLPGKLIEVVPNGVDIETFYGSYPACEVLNQVIFSGAMDYYPNISAALFFAHQCWPFIRAHVPDATWQIVGRNPPPEVQRLAELPGVTVTGTVPDVRPYLAASAVALAPLQIGSGTRLKILEALAMQKAIVSTSVGCEGLSVIAGKHLVVADQAEAFARAVVTFLSNPEMRTVFGTAGRALVEAEYSWKWCGDRLLHILEEREREIVC